MVQVDDKREAILQATLRLVSQYGFHGTAMSKVAKEAKVSAGIIYHYFANKDEMMVELYRTIKERSTCGVLDNHNADAPLRVQVEQIWADMIRYFINNPEQTQFVSQFTMSPYMTPEVEASVACYYKPLREIFIKAMEEMIIKQLPDSVFAAFVLDVPSALVSRQASGQIELTDDVVDLVIDSLWKAIRL